MKRDLDAWHPSRRGITFYFVRALYCYLGGADASANTYLERGLKMLPTPTFVDLLTPVAQAKLERTP